MRNSLLFILALFIFSNCKKDDLADRLPGTWKSEKVVLNGTDITSLTRYEIVLKSNGDLDQTQITTFPVPVTNKKDGTWTTDEKKDEIIITYTGETPDVWEVQSFDDSNMTVENAEGSDILRIDFKKQ